MPAFQKILIANRGEIACRIARTARRLGIACAAVYTDADREALHIREADEAIHIGSYLSAAEILEAANRTKADAIHPGYGFLAENAAFAEACAAAGFTFIGPRPDSIRDMGSKASGRLIAQSCGVPVVPGYQGPDLDLGAKEIGFPLLVKASAGGGGRGMRIVESAKDFASSAEAAHREAKAAFGDGTLILERYIPFSHHVEVQIFGDAQDRVIHLFERDCSIQRRHQKLIEESPSPAINDVTRNHLFEASVAIGQSMRYLNAGTVEFLVAPTGEFYFIEVNTRIQVEHPVTEAITGLDLVEMQIRIAEGRSLDEFSLVLEPMGHAIEVRLCAEDPLNEFAPSTGRLAVWSVASDRVDSGVAAGSEVSRYYDSLLAKLIVHGSTRQEAIERMLANLRRADILGVETNRDYLIQLLSTPEFREGRAHTAFLPAAAAMEHSPAIDASAQALALWIFDEEIGARAILPAVGAYRNNPWRTPSIKLHHHEREFDVTVVGSIINKSLGSMTAEIEGVARTYRIAWAGTRYLISSPLGSFQFERVDRHPKPALAGSSETASSPMPGQVLRLLVEPGQAVNTGDPLVVLEAMKMEQTIKSRMTGTVSAILVKVGDVVSPGQTLVLIGGA